MCRNTDVKCWRWILLILSLWLASVGPLCLSGVQAQSDFDCATVTGIPEVECEALVAIYEATDGINWHNNAGWLQTTTPCDWYGVTCKAGHVINLLLSWNNLSGALPSEIGDLTALTTLNLGHNALTALPAEIGNLTALEWLSLYDNNLNALPPEIGHLSALWFLSVGENGLTALPPEIGNLNVLTELGLGHNALTALPAEIWNLTTLTYLDLAGNALTALPADIGDLTALEHLHLNDNALTVLPAEIGNLTALTKLWLGGNTLTALPPEIGNLSVLWLFHGENNSLTALPAEIGNLTALTELSLDHNALTALPAEIGNLIALKELGVSYNDLTSLPPEIGNLSGLTSLDLWHNDLTALPPEIGNLSGLTDLDVTDNDLTALPAEIGNLSALEDLYLSDNALKMLPSETGNLSALTNLYLGHNALTALPPEIGDLTALTRLWLENNALTVLPPEIGNLSALTNLGLIGNALTALPPEIGHLSTLGYLNAANNALATLPAEIGDLTALRSFYLHNNPLKGEIPADLTLLMLYQLTFYGTQWCVPATGDVPTWLAGLDEVYGTGQICGQAPGSLRGMIADPHANPVGGIQVRLYRPALWGQWHYVTATQTGADGRYEVGGLGQVGYRVQFVDPTHTYAPEYYDDHLTLDQATPVTATLGETRVGIDAVLNVPQSPAVTVEPGSGSVTVNPQDGTVIVNMTYGNINDIMVTRTVTCVSGSLTGVTLRLDPPGTTYSMTLIRGSDYQATVPAADITQDADLMVAAMCGVTTTEMTIGHVNLYNPSGMVSDAITGQPVEGATVTLYRVPGWRPKVGPDDDRPNTCQSNDSKSPDEPWSQSAPTDLGLIVNTEVTPVDPSLAYQHTDSAGYYGWDIGEGCWYVKVAAKDYKSRTSPVVGVPPQVTDLDLALVPSNVTGLLTKLSRPGPSTTITNGSSLIYTLAFSVTEDTILHLYDPLVSHMTWKGFVRDAPDTLTYTTHTLTGTVALSATTPLIFSFAVEVNVPEASFVGEYAQVANTAYYYFPGETLALKRASNTVTHTVHYQPSFDIFLPLVLRES